MSIEINGSRDAMVRGNTTSTDAGQALTGNSDPKRGVDSEGNATDRVTLTGAAEELRDLEEAMGTEPAFDAAQVERLRLAIQSGDYVIDDAHVADKLIELESDLFE